ncbi:MAG TPA: hypothetical protein VHM01_20990 [Alphaproteobacteria bacterium]|nr:hypothetical protein [Alphaproteobacteria bacterium]
MRTARFFVPLLPVIAAAALLSACNRTPPACPRASIISDGSTVTKFREGTGRDLTDVVMQGEIVDVAVECDYDRRGVDVALQVAIAATRGPADRSRVAEFDYFVAIADPQRNILAKEVFRVRFQFQQNQARTGIVEDIEPRIPLKSRAEGVEYQIIVGFQLTPEEIEWNRNQRPR